MTEVRKRGLSFQATLLIAVAILSQAGTALIYIAAARSLDPSEFGIIATVVAVSTAVAAYVDTGTNSYLVRQYSNAAVDGAEIASRTAIKSGFLLFVGTAAIAIGLLVGRPEFIAVPFIAIGTFGAQATSVVIRGSLRSERLAFVGLSDRAVALGVFFGLKALGTPTAGSFLIAVSLGPIVGFLVGSRLASGIDSTFKYRLKRVNPWSGAKGYVASSVALASQGLDIPLLSLVGGSSPAGAYAAISRWTAPLGLVANTFATVATPIVSRASNWADAWNRVRSAIWLPALAAFGAATLAVASAPAVALLLGPAYSQSAPLLRLLALGAFFSVLSQPLAAALQARSHENSVAISLGISVSLYLLTIVILSVVGNSLAVGYGQLALQISLFAMLVFSLRRSRAETREPSSPQIASLGGPI